MKKSLTVLAAAAMAGTLILGGCAKPEAVEAEKPETAEDTVLGGWTPYTEYVQLLDENDKVLFEEAMEGLVGVKYTPVQLLATQVVSGTNYAFLASAENVSTEADKGFAIVTIYKNLEGKTEVLAINRIDIADVKTLDNVNDPNVVGGWTCTDIGKVAGISAEGEAAISKALEGFTGVNLKPIVLLGTQLVSGTNYMFLCRGNTVTENPVTSLYVTVVYEDLEGNCTITDNKVFDLNTYVTPAE